MHRQAAFSRKHARREIRKLKHAIGKLERAVSDLLCAIQRVRFANGVQCLYCHATRVIKWGKASGRQRYRCNSCRRTFSDLTLTAAAYTKHLTRWLAYAECMIEGLSIRRSAARVGISPSTAFRWRHAILKAIRLEDCTTLEGPIQIQETRFLFSAKGQWHLLRPARRRGHGRDIRALLFGHSVTALFACDENQSVLSGVVLAGRPGAAHLHNFLHKRTRAEATLVAPGGRFSAYATAAFQLGLNYEPVVTGDSRSPTDRLATARACVRRFRGWLDRFRGVATKYLPNYLAWHRALDARGQDESVRRGRWPVGTHPTLPIVAWFPGV